MITIAMGSRINVIKRCDMATSSGIMEITYLAKS